MGESSTVALLYDAIDSVESFISVFVYVYTLLILAYVISGWVTMPYSPWLNRIQRFLYDVCEPYLRVFRRLLPSTGAIDLSPMLALITLVVIDRLLIWILEHFH